MAETKGFVGLSQTSVCPFMCSHLMDEHDTYGPGSWFRFPIGVPHAPYTKGEDCTLLIREGDLVW